MRYINRLFTYLLTYLLTIRYDYTLWSINNVAVNVLQQLLQILTDLDNFCIRLTRNEQCISAYQNVSLHLACVSTLPCKIRKQRFFHVSTETLTLKKQI